VQLLQKRPRVFPNNPQYYVYYSYESSVSHQDPRKSFYFDPYPSSSSSERRKQRRWLAGSISAGWEPVDGEGGAGEGGGALTHPHLGAARPEMTEVARPRAPVVATVASGAAEEGRGCGSRAVVRRTRHPWVLAVRPEKARGTPATSAAAPSRASGEWARVD
jgi:hypothetical protein